MKDTTSLNTSEATNMVPVEEAAAMTQQWQQLINSNTGEHFPKSYRFDKVDFTQILNKEGVEYVRIYPAVESDGTVNLLAVGVDSEGNDIIGSDALDSGIYNFALPCPKTCGSSVLLHEIES